MKKNLLFLALIFSFTIITGYTHAQQGQRLVGICQYYVLHDSSSYIQEDSLVYRYMGAMSLIDSAWGGSYAYDTSMEWTYYNGTGYAPTQYTQQIFSANNLPLSDTISYRNSLTSNFFYRFYQTDSFDVNNHVRYLLAYVYDTTARTWSNYSYNMIGFNNANEMLENNIMTWDSSAGTYDTSIANYYSYNSANQLLTNTVYWGNFPSPFYSRNVYTYDSLGRLSTNTVQILSHDSVNWTNQLLTVNTYDSLNNVSFTLGFSWINHTWDTTQRLYYTYDASHNETGYSEQNNNTPGGWVNYQKYTATYDAFNMITSHEQISWDTATASWVPHQGDNVYHYYYEQYSPTTGEVTIAPAGDVRIYPVPAADMLSVDIRWADTQDADITIYDMSGRKCGEWQTGRTSSYHGYVPVSAMHAGIYILQVHGTSGIITRSFNIVR